MVPGGMLVELEHATRRWHREADEVWLDLHRPDVTPRDYIGHLVRMYGFEAPLESACAYTPHLATVLGHRPLRRAGRIALDLLALGLTPMEVAALPQCLAITTFRDIPEALGWLYVIERTTLHHDHLLRVLGRRLPIVSRASAYLSMADSSSGLAWHRFGEMLGSIATRPEIEAEIITAASAAFEAFVHWNRRGAALRRTG